MKQFAIPGKARLVAPALSCGLAVLGVAAHAATYYVDFSLGNDANNGTTAVTPWQHCPGDTNSSGNVLQATLKPGDTVIFKGGIQYTNFPINLNWSGTPGNPITYDGNSAGTFGMGRAIFNANNSTNSVAHQNFGFSTAYENSSAQYLSNVVINNVEMENFGGHGSIPLLASNNIIYQGYAIFLADSHDVIIENSYIHDIGDWTNMVNMSQDFMDGVGIALESTAYNMVVSNCELTHVALSGIQVYVGWNPLNYEMGLNLATNILITGCNFHDYIRWGVDICAVESGGTLRGITVDNCQFHDNWQTGGPAYWLGVLNAQPHVDSIILRVGGNPPNTNIIFGTPDQPNIVRNCKFYQNCSSNVCPGDTGLFATTFGGTLLLYNNTVKNIQFMGHGFFYAQDGAPPGSTPVDYHIYNNTFYDETYAVSLRTASTPPAPWAITNGSVRIDNNIFYKADNSAAVMIVSSFDPYSNPTEMDYNLYVTGRSDGLLASLTTNGVRGYQTLAQLQALGYETHGQMANPLFKSASYLPPSTSSSLNDLHLLSNSPAILSGTNLSSFFTADADGYARPASGLWTIGAYENNVGLAAPTGLRVLP